jgi:hypothetical protein
MANFGVLGDLLPWLLGLALVAGAASFVISRMTRPQPAGPAERRGMARFLAAAARKLARLR